MRGFSVPSWRISLAAALGMAVVTLGTAPVMAARSGHAPGTVRPTSHSLDASTTTLAQAPKSLQAAVRARLGALNTASAAPLPVGRLTASDGAADDTFGSAVAISGSTAVVGAEAAAYAFVASGSIWSQQAKLTGADVGAGDEFGASVAISGSTAVVGAPGKNSFTGAVYVFVRSGTVWTQQAKLTTSDGFGSKYFGTSVAISGSTAVVGAIGLFAAYVFVRSASTWAQQAKLTASDGLPQDYFGNSVAISGSTAVVGAPSKNSQTGAAYVFVGSATVWSQQAELTAADGTASDQFGDSVAISGSTAVVGAPGKNSNTGSAYVFVGSGTAWSPQAELTASDGTSSDKFGSSVAISGSTAVAGASGRKAKTGAAYPFKRSGAVWTQQPELAACEGVAGDAFGAAVAISGSTALVGAPNENSFTGAAYAYPLGGITWSCKAPAPIARAGLAATALKGKIYAIGGYNGGALNAAEVYDPTTDSWASVASMPTARGGLAAATANGKVYAIGGCSGGTSRPSVCDFVGTSLNAVEAYNPMTNRWTTKAAMPTARADLAAVTGKDGKIYAIGGWSVRSPNDPAALNTVEAYDPLTNTWSNKAPMPTARYWVSAALASDGKIYVIGGVDSSTNTVPAVEAYDPSTDTWATLPPLPGVVQRAEVAIGVAFLGGKIYAIGGTDIDFTPYATVEAYSLKTGTWTSQTTMPTARGYLAAVATGGIVYAIGGYNTLSPYTGDLSQVEAF